MGAWGLEILEDDVALDVRDQLESYLDEGLSARRATGKVLRDFRMFLDDQDDEPIVWLALALTQSERGVLTTLVKKRALEVIDSGRDLLRWEAEPNQVALRKVVLQNLRDHLTSSKPLPKPFRSTNPWPTGTVVSYRLLNGSFCLFCVVGECNHQTGTDPVVEVLDWQGHTPPSMAELAHLKTRASTPAQSPIAIGAASEPEIPSSRLQVVGRLRLAHGNAEPVTFTLWRFLDGVLASHFGL